MQQDNPCKASNNTSVSGFLLLEFSQDQEMQLLYFILFLIWYLATATGNLFIISAVVLDHHLHTPMYIFLMNLAIQDLGSVSVIIPKSMTNSLMNTRHISYFGCVAQVFFYIFFSSANFSLLTVMAYDRYVAICYPLQYEMVMNKQSCMQMVVSVWITGILYGMLHTGGTFATPFCSNTVNQFFCEVPHLLELSCSDLYLIEIGVIVFSTVVALGCFLFIIVTYVHIFKAVLRIPSVHGRQKAFSTCLPHLIVFSTFLFTGTFAYLRPQSSSPSNVDLISAVIYSLIPPMMNPVIYGMRNKEIKNAVTKIFCFRYPSTNIFSNVLH